MMLRELLVLFFLPLIFVFASNIFLKRFVFYRKLDLLEKYLMNLCVSTGFFEGTFVLFGSVFSSGFGKFLTLVFLSGLLCVVLSLSKESIILFWKNVLKLNIKLRDKYFRIFFLIVLLFLLKTLGFCLFKPIIDPDVVNSYLPYARSIYLADNIPERNFYNDALMIYPPIGGPTLYSVFYFLTDNIYTESFRLLPFIYLLGIVIAFFKLAKEIVGYRLSLLSLAIFLIFPFWDEYVFESLFYPDIITLFLFLSFFYFFIKEKYFFNSSFKLKKYLLISFFLSTTLLFKLQYIIVYYFLIMIYLVFYLPKKRWSRLLFIVACLPILYRLKRGVGLVLDNVFLVFVFATLLYMLLVLINRFKKKTVRINPAILVIFFPAVAVAVLTYFKNFYFYNSILSPVSKAVEWTSTTRESLGLRLGFHSSWIEWVAFFLPVFSIFWLIPKVLGVVDSIRGEKTRIILLFSLTWYAVITILFDTPNPRGLMPIFPFLAIFIALGVKKIVGLLKINFLKYTRSFVILSMVFSLFSSTFLLRNGGLILYGGEGLRRSIVSNELGRSSREDVAVKTETDANIFKKVVNVFVVLTSRGDYYQKNFSGLVILSIILGLLLVFLSYFIAKKNYLNYKRSLFLIVLFFFIPYLMVFLVVSKGKVWDFADIEKRDVYSYWGQSKYVVPYLLINADKDSKIVFWGVPSGLSYYTNLKVYNLLYGYTLGDYFKDVYYYNDLERIYRFYKEKGYNYFVIGVYPNVSENLEIFKKNTKMLDVLEDERFAVLKIKPENDNLWYVYKLK